MVQAGHEIHRGKRWVHPGKEASGAKVGEHGSDATVVVLSGRQIELGQDAADVLGDRVSAARRRP